MTTSSWSLRRRPCVGGLGTVGVSTPSLPPHFFLSLCAANATHTPHACKWGWVAQQPCTAGVFFARISRVASRPRALSPTQRSRRRRPPCAQLRHGGISVSTRRPRQREPRAAPRAHVDVTRSKNETRSRARAPPAPLPPPPLLPPFRARHTFPLTRPSRLRLSRSPWWGVPLALPPGVAPLALIGSAGDAAWPAAAMVRGEGCVREKAE